MSRPSLARATVAAVLGFLPATSQGGVPTAPVISATKTGTFTPDANNRATPGGTIEYKNVLTNTGSAPALGVTYADPTPANTTLVPGSVNVSPVAVNDSYAVVGNTLLRAGGSPGTGPEVFNANGAMANDREFLGDTAKVTAVQAVTTVTSGTITAATTHGTVVMTVADGSFTYLPAAGYVGADSFTYKIQDKGTDGVAGNADDLSDTATVALNVSNKVWYVNIAAAAGGDGRSGTPFKNLSDVSGATGPDGVSDIIYLFPGTYPGGITLLNNQTLWGANEALVVGGNTLAAAGTDPVVTNSGGNGVTLAGGNVLKGFTVGDTSGFDISNTAGLSAGSLTISNLILQGTGGLVNIANGGALTVTLDSATTTSATTLAINLVSATGTFTVSAGAISGAAGDDVVISGGTVAYNHTGTITNTAGHSVNISGKTTSGNVTFNSAISDTGTGILLNNNGGSTIRFDGGLTLNTGANAAFTATGGGTVIVTDPAGSDNTITTTSAAALTVANTTIGSGGLVFRSISSNGGPTNGITLDSTGTTAGLTVTGDGTNNRNGSGGIIQNKTGADAATNAGIGIYLNNTQSVSLSSMNLTNFDNLAIFGKAVNGFTLRGATVSGTIGTNTASNDAAIGFGLTTPGGANGLSGTALIDNCEITGAIEHNVEVYQQSGNFALTISNSSIHDNSTAGGSDGIQMEISGTATATVNINHNTFDDNKSQAIQLSVLGSAAVTSTIDTNTVIRSTQGNEGFVLTNGGDADLTATISNNNISGLGGAAIFVGQDPGNASNLSELRATITGNTIVAPTTATNHALIAYLSATTGQISQARLLIDSNTITQNSTSGVARGIIVDTPDSARTPNVNATVTNNKVEVNDGATGVAGIVVQARNTATGHFNVRNNDVDFDNGTPTGIFGIRVRQTTAGSTASLERGTVVIGSTAATALSSNNTLSTTEVLGTVSVVENGTVLLPGNPLLFAPVPETTQVSPGTVPDLAENVATTPAAPAPEKDLTSATPPALTQEALDGLVQAAISRWEATGLTAEQVKVLHGLHFGLSDLPALHLGSASGDDIRISPHAAGQNWFVDPSPLGDGKFTAPAGSVDLLTTLMHEMGHALGLPDQYDVKDRDSIMFGFLHQGERRLPAKNIANGIRPNSSSAPQFLAAPIAIGDLPPGKSVTIVYSVTINNPTTVTSITSQGTATDTNSGTWSTNSLSTPVEQPPVLSPVAISLAEDGVFTFAATSFDSGFTDPNSDTAATVRITSLPADGVLKLSGTTISSVPTDIARANLGNLTYVPAADSNAATSFGWNATDGVSYAASASVVNISITAVNDAPTLNAISAPAEILEDAGQQTINLSGITAGGGETQVLTVTATSGNTTLIADPTVTYTSPGTTGTLTYTPVANQSGTALITVKVTDDGTGTNSVTRTFTVSVSAVNDAPTLDAISNPAVLPVSSPQQTVNLTGISEGPLESAQTLTITAVSGNPSLVPTPTVIYTEGNATGSLAYTPVAGQSGSALITVTVTDNGGTADGGVNSVQQTFTVTVSEAVSIAATDATADEAADTGTFTFTRSSGATAITVNFQRDATTTAGNSEYTLTGTGVTYDSETGAGSVSFPAGVTSVPVTLTGLPDAIQAAEPAEIVKLNVVASAGVYQVGSSGSATVTIAANGLLVTNTNDSGEGSLRQAVLNANAVPGADTITFSDGTGGNTDFSDATPDIITLTSGEIAITQGLTLAGQSPDLLTIERSDEGGTPNFRVFNISGGETVALSGITVANGSTSSAKGGGILMTNTPVTLTRCVVRDNTAGDWGGGFAEIGGTLVVQDCVIQGNVTGAFGAGFETENGTTTLVNSTIRGNLAQGGSSNTGAGGLAFSGTVRIVSCAFVDNQAVGGTGGFFNYTATTSIINSTISGNTAAAGGAGGVYNQSGSLAIIQSTISNNTSSLTGGGVLNKVGSVFTSISNSIIAGNTGGGVGSDLNGDIVDLGNNLVGITDGSTGVTLSTLKGTSASPLDARLAPLSNNGGASVTHALLADSPALNAGSTLLIPADTLDLDGDSDTAEPIPFDQRGSGFLRAVGTVDIGAFELQKSIAIAADAASKAEGTGTGNTAFTFTVSRTGSTSGDVTMDYAVSGADVNAADFGGTLPSGQVTIADGQASAMITVNVSKDSTVESDEAFTVTVSNASGGYALTTATASSTITNDDFEADLAVTVTDGVTTATPGGSVTYTITASNAGPHPALNAAVLDTFPAALTATWTAVGAGGGTVAASGSGNINESVNLPVGGSVTFTVSATIAPGATGTLTNTASVSSSVTDPSPGNNSATDSDTLSPQADLSITKTDGVTTATSGGSVTYTITASNAGPSNAVGATVADTFPASLSTTWTAVGAGGGTVAASGSGNINELVNLPSGGSVTFTVTANISSGATGTLSNTATVTAPGGVTDPSPANNSATDTDTLTQLADLSITKTDGVTAATSGGSVTYSITASNAGPSNVTATVADTFPASLTGTWTAVGAGGGTVTASGSGNINQSVNLPAGGSVTFTVNATISAAATGTLTNTATVSSGVTDPTPGNNTATDTDTLAVEANLSITKTDGVTTATAGNTVTYIITASNAGPSNAPGATVADTLPASIVGATWTAVGAGGGTATASGSGNINDTVNLPAGGSVTYTVTAPISAAATGTLSNTATVTAPGGVTDSVPGNNIATDTDTLTSQADLAITKTDGVTNATPGTSVTYTIIASNAGPSNVTTATVADTLPATIIGATWTSAVAGGATATASGSGNINDTVTLPAGGSVTYTVTAPISAAATGTLTNTATVSSAITDPTPANNSATDTDTLTPKSDLSITKTDGVTTAVPGTSVTYTITASNAGPSNATATVADTLPAIINGATWTATGTSGGTATASGSGNINDTVSLPVGASVTYTVTAPISSTATGTLSNTATVSSTVTDPTPANNSATDTDTLTPQANLAITKTDGVTTAVPGNSVTYTITASNAGPSTVASATVADTLPAIITGATWTAVGAGGGTATASGSGNINDTVSLPVGGSVTYTVTAPISATATGSLSNTATVSSAVTDPTPGNNSATDTDTLTPQANLAITKSDGVTTATAGNTVSYTITASNAGPSNAPGATVADTLPASIVGATWTAVGAGGATATASGSGNINDTVNLPAGGSVTYTVTAPISAAATGTLSNTATVTAPGGVTDSVPGNNTATDTDTLTSQADLSITKTDGVANATPGTSVTYTIIASNAGPSNVTTATVADTLPASIVGATWTAVGAGGATATASGSGNINDTVTLPAGGSVTYTVTAPVSAAASGTLSNTATVSSAITDPTPANNSATDTDTLTPKADLSITKTDGVTTAVPGTSVTYTITASNAGPSNVTATVADTLPAIINGATWTATGTSGGTATASGSGNINDTVSLPVGASVTYTVTAPISSVATGTLSNTATVSSAVTDPSPANNSATDTDTLTPRADLALTISDAPDPVNALGNVTYTINLTNNGPSDAVSPSVTLPLPASTTFVSADGTAGWTAANPSVGGVGSVTFTNASLATGGTASFTVVAKVDITVVNDSHLIATATVSSATTDPTSANNSATADTLAKSGADLVLTLADSPDPVIAGTNLTYTVQVANNGPLDAENVSIGDTLPAGTTFVSLAVPSGWSSTTPAVGSGGNVTITHPLFANTGTATFTLVVKVGNSVADGSSISNTASIGSGTVDIVPGNNSATVATAVTTRADLAVQLSATPVTAPKLSNVTYTITLTNNGPSTSVAPNVAFPIPAQMTFVSLTKPAGWTATNPAVGGNGNVSFSAATLANGASVSCTVVAKVNSVLNGTVISATTTASETTVDPAAANNTASAAVAVGTLLPGVNQPITKNIPVNSQTGLFDVTVNVTNTTPNPINGFRLHVDYSAYKAAFPSLRLYNASSAANASDVYVDYPYPVKVDGVIALKLSFYTSTRTFPSPFKPVFTIELLPASQVAGTNGSGVQPRLVRLVDQTVLLEFPSVAGRWYRVRYSPDLIHWYDCPVPLQAGSSRMQWIDSGPPFTNVPPKNAPSRFYRVNEINAQ